MPVVVNHHLSEVAAFRARKNQDDPESVRKQVDAEYKRAGEYEFIFQKPTEPAIQQLRNKLLIAKVGSMNLQIDEIGSNLFKAKECFPAFLELWDGKLKNNLTKNTQDSIRSEAVYGVTPTNMMLFGVPSALLDNGKSEDEFTSMLEIGFARRSFFGYVSEEAYARELVLPSPQERLALAKRGLDDSALEGFSEAMKELADPLRLGTKLPVPDDTALLLFAYENDCKTRAFAMPPQQVIAKFEMEHRAEKALRLAGAYAFCSLASQIDEQHLMSAIALTEESGDAFTRIQHRDLPHVKLAKHLGTATQELTKVSLREQLPFFKKGTKQERDEMLSEAIDWGYTNNIAISRRFSRGVEFYSGEMLKSTDLNKLIISHSGQITENYRSQEIKWEQLDRLAMNDGVHWITHHLDNGFDGRGYRHNDNCLAGFNVVVLDVDHGPTIQSAQKALHGYKAFYYTTKRHTPAEHRFRIVLPLNYTLELDADDFAQFMKNLYDWLPFDSDEQTGQRSRKWLSNKGHHVFTKGKMLDALPFIPRTTRQTEFAERLLDLENMDGLDRWFILNTSEASSNRNANLIRYGLLLVDAGIDVVGARDRILAINNQLDVPLKPAEVDSTIMKTVTKKILAATP